MHADRLTFVAKQHQSCFVGSTLESTLRLASIDELWIAGINADICVLKTALDAFEKAFKVRVVVDAIGSYHGAAGIADGLRTLRNFWGNKDNPMIQLVNASDLPAARKGWPLADATFPAFTTMYWPRW